jgi:hypothetical protein
MSSATSIESSDSTRPADTTLRPEQFFLLAGMLSATAVVVLATGQSPAAIITLSLTVVAASLVAVGVYRALVPLVTAERAEEPTSSVGRKRGALEREKTLVMRSIKELEFDFAMGKIAQSDYDEMIGRLRSRAIGLMRRLDTGAGAGYRGAIEEELKSRLTARTIRPPKPEAVPAESEPRSAIASCECGVVNDADARFCKNCGIKLIPA